MEKRQDEGILMTKVGTDKTGRKDKEVAETVQISRRDIFLLY